VAEAGIAVIDEQALAGSQVGAEQLEVALGGARRILRERLARYYALGRRLAVDGRSVLLVDDSLASSCRALAAARALRGRGAARVIFAVPVAAVGAAIELGEWVDDVVSVESGHSTDARASVYEHASPTSAQEVAALLSEHSGAVERAAVIDAEGIGLRGLLTVPWGAYARGVVIVAATAGSNQLETHDRILAEALNRVGLATLLVDLLSGPG